MIARPATGVRPALPRLPAPRLSVAPAGAGRREGATAVDGAVRAQAVSGGDVFISLLFSLTVVLGFVATDDRLQHWLVFPALVCGTIVGVDAVRWFRGKLDPFDPVGLLGLFGLHFFFLAPLLHVHWDYWLRYVQHPPEWRGWLAIMATLNAAGLVVYLAARALFSRRVARPSRVVLEVDPHRFLSLVAPLLVLTTLLQALFIQRTGGLTGLAAPSAETIESVRGWGIVLMFSESFPILAIMAYAVWARARGVAPSWVSILVALGLFFVAKLLFGGLRGSRSNTIWGVIWGVGILHLWVRRFPRWVFVAGLSFMVGFMYLYGFYKSFGTDAIAIIQDAELREQRSGQSGRTIEATILSDLGRTDIQAFLLYRLTDDTAGGAEFEYGYGRTYVGAVTLLIPAALWPDRPPGKVHQGTDAMYGEGTFANGIRSSNVYGLAGEAMLNFGPLAVPFAFVVLGWAVATVGRHFRDLDPNDSRRLILPFFIILTILVLTADSDGIVFYTFKNGTLPFLLILMGSRRRPR